jgi:hypothetical protein
MPLIQGGPPEWIWERTPDALRWEVVPSQTPHEPEPVFELRLSCGLGIMRLQFFTDDELRQLAEVVDNHLRQSPCPQAIGQPAR